MNKLEQALTALQLLDQGQPSQQALKQAEQALAFYDLTLEDYSKLAQPNILKLFQANTFRQAENFTFILNEAWQNMAKPDIFYSTALSIFGSIFIAFTAKEICFLNFGDHEKNKHDLFKIFHGSKFYQDQSQAQKLADAIFQGSSLPLLYKGSQLEKELYTALLEISTLSNYSALAQQTSSPKAIRAVASYVGKNYITYLIPCHKVLSKSGKIGGFAYDINLKKLLILHDLKKAQT